MNLKVWREYNSNNVDWGSPATGLPLPTFVDSSANPAVLQDYDESVLGTITLEVTDGDGGTTVLHYNLPANQFPNNVVSP